MISIWLCLLALAVTVALPGLAEESAAATAPPPIPNASAPVGIGVNVRDFGAKGDGVADDTAAIRRALDAATLPGAEQEKPAPAPDTARSLVIFPPGIYRVTDTLQLEPRHAYLVLQGTGAVASFGRGATALLYDGPAGKHLIDSVGAGFMEIRNLFLDGNEKANVLLRINATPDHSHGGGWWTLYRVVFRGADTGIECGGASSICAADMTFYDIEFLQLKTGFRSMNGQNLDYVFIRPHACSVGTVLHFQQGGCSEAVSLFAINCPKIVQIDSGGINAGTFHFSNMRIDVNDPVATAPKPIILEAKGETVVKFSALDVICQNAFAGDDRTPCFIIGSQAQVQVDSSMLTGKIAKISGGGWLQLNNCRFRVHADPRKIECDADSGFEVRNCLYVADQGFNDQYNVLSSKYITRYRRLPKEVLTQKDLDAPAPPAPAVQ